MSSDAAYHRAMDRNDEDERAEERARVFQNVDVPIVGHCVECDDVIFADDEYWRAGDADTLFLCGLCGERLGRVSGMRHLRLLLRGRR